jgi:copper(I)-binding protein
MMLILAHYHRPADARRRKFLAVTLLAVCTPALAALPPGVAAQPKALGASNGRVKPSADKSSASAYAQLTNPTMYDVYFTSASADAAGRVEFREVTASSPTAQPAKHITVPAYESLELGPRGAYLELLDLKKPLAEGDTVTLTLTTDQGIAVQLSAVVRQEP